MHLLTWHGTVVCRADAAGPLRHVAIPLLYSATPVRLEPSALVPGHYAAHADLGTVLIARGSHGAALTIRRDKAFMCADMPSRRISFDRLEAGGWEMFLPITPQDLRDLRHILQHHWIMRETRQVMRRRSVLMLERLKLRIGTCVADLATLTRPIVAARDEQGLPVRLSVPRGNDYVELAIAGARDSEWVRPGDGADTSRQAAEAIALALHRNITGLEPDQEIFESHAALLQRAGVLEGIEAILDQLIPPPPLEEMIRQQAVPVVEPAIDPVAWLEEAVAEFGPAPPTVPAGPRDPAQDDEILRMANERLRRFAAGADMQKAVSFGTYDRSGAGAHVHDEVCVLDISDDAVRFRVPDDAPPPWMIMRRSLALFYLLDRMFSSGIRARGRHLTELGDGGHLDSIAYCSSARTACLVPDWEFLSTGGYEDFRALVAAKGVAWSARAPKVFWRGSTSGSRRKVPPAQAEGDDFTWLPRLDLCRRARDSKFAAHYDVGISNITRIDEPELVERIWQAGLCKPSVPREAFLGHKALIVIDGNSNAWSALFCALLTGACVLLVASPRGYRQWYYDRLQPWLHYVPVSEDLKDLDRVVKWVLDNDSDARAIGEAGQAFANALTFESALEDGVATLSTWLATPRT